MSPARRRRATRRQAAKDGQPIPMTSLAEYRRTDVVISDAQVLALLVREQPMHSWFNNFNFAFHNHSSQPLNAAELRVLGLGHKFIPTNYGPSQSIMKKAMQQFARRVYLRDFFGQIESTDSAPPPDTRLRVRNQQWHPLQDGKVGDEPYQPSPGVQEFIDGVDAQLHEAQARVQQIRVSDNLTAAERSAIQTLRHNVDLVISESDKNMGLLVMDASQYRDLGYECLRKSALQVGTDDFGCIEADLEQSIVNSVRAQYVAVCDEYEDLISSWKGTELDWKRKFILRALKVNPNTGKPYKVANLRLMKKVQKPGARDVAGVHVTINQPFALLDSIELSPAVKNLPHFLQDSDSLTREVSQIRLKNTSGFVTIDIVRLYPSIDLQDCCDTVEQFMIDSLPDDADSTVLREVMLMSALRRITLLSNYCYFDGQFFKFHRRFPTGIANGRELAEIYLHCVERSVLQAHEQQLVFCRRYVDDLCAMFNRDQDYLTGFINDYRTALQLRGLDITAETSTESAVMLDQHMSKGPTWSKTGRLDLRVYQKPMSAYLYIPAHSDHAAHIRSAWIRGELIRYIKRSSLISYYIDVRRHFIDRLVARGYEPAFLQPIFDGVFYSDRWRYLTRRHSQSAGATQICSSAQSDMPAVLALTLPYTQRLSAMKVPEAIFSCSQRWLQENNNVPIEVRSARFILARATTGKLAALLIDYRFPRRID